MFQLHVTPSPTEDEDRATPAQSLFDPNSTSTSIWEYEDDGDGPGYTSLPLHVNINEMELPLQSHHIWEAEDVGDFIVTLDESVPIEDCPPVRPARSRSRCPRPKSMYASGTDSITSSLGPVEKWAKLTTSTLSWTRSTDELAQENDPDASDDNILSLESSFANGAQNCISEIAETGKYELTVFIVGN